jgi:hypothetical protein
MGLKLFVCSQEKFGLDVVKALRAAGNEIVGVAPPP